MSLIEDPRNLQCFLEERLPPQWRFLATIAPNAVGHFFRQLSTTSPLVQHLGNSALFRSFLTRENATLLCDNFTRLFGTSENGVCSRTRNIIASSHLGGEAGGFTEHDFSIMANEMDNATASFLSKIAMIETFASGILIGVQCCSLFQAWNAISAAENLVAKSREASNQITVNVQKLEQMLAEIKLDMADFAKLVGIDLQDDGGFNEDQFDAFIVNDFSDSQSFNMNLMQLKLNKANRLYTETKSLMSK